MKCKPRLLLAFAIGSAIGLNLPLTACTQGTVQSVGTDAVVASDATYVAASKFGETMVKLGKMDKTKFKDLDNRAYSALLGVRALRGSADAASVATASTGLSTAIAALYAAVQ